MKEVRGGPPDAVRARGKIDGPTAITPISAASAAHLQGARRSAPRAPARSLAERQSAELRRLQRQRYAQRIWRLGDRVEFELVEHLITAFDLDEDAVARVLDRFAGLDIEALRAAGGDRLPPAPIRSVPR
jgi:hypothetical protein